MRSTLALVSFTMLAAACGNNAGGGGGGGGGTPDAPGGGEAVAFEVQSTDITLAPGQEVTYCYYFHTSNTTDVAVNKWVSDLTPGSHHMILFTGGSHADGLDMSNSCGLGTGSVTSPPVWVYSTQTPHQEMDLPADDGSGKPLAQKIAPNTAGALQMHYINTTDAPLTAHVSLKAYALPASAPYTQTAAYVTYNNDISIPPNATGFAVSATCPVPAGVKFWAMSTHSHKQSVATDVKDGTSVVFQATDWEHPGAQVWGTAPFYTFTAPNLTWECTYDNTGDNKNNTIVAGQSAQTNEMCMASGYFFPATGPKFVVKANGSCFSL